MDGLQKENEKKVEGKKKKKNEWGKSAVVVGECAGPSIISSPEYPDKSPQLH